MDGDISLRRSVRYVMPETSCRWKYWIVVVLAILNKELAYGIMHTTAEQQPRLTKVSCFSRLRAILRDSRS